MIGRLSDAAIAASIAPTLRALHASPNGRWSHQLLAQLIAVVEYGQQRGPDPAEVRAGALSAALDDLTGNPLVPAEGEMESRAAAALVAATARDDADADAVRATLRPVLVAELDEELAATMVMMDGFRGRVGDA